jgi:hypothetical protein
MPNRKEHAMRGKTIYVCLRPNHDGTFEMYINRDAPDASAEGAWAVSGPAHYIDNMGLPANRKKYSEAATIQWLEMHKAHITFQKVKGFQ